MGRQPKAEVPRVLSPMIWMTAHPVRADHLQHGRRVLPSLKASIHICIHMYIYIYVYRYIYICVGVVVGVVVVVVVVSVVVVGMYSITRTGTHRCVHRSMLKQTIKVRDICGSSCLVQGGHEYVQPGCPPSGGAYGSARVVGQTPPPPPQPYFAPVRLGSRQQHWGKQHGGVLNVDGLRVDESGRV